MDNECIVNSLNDVILYLNSINEYVSSILLYHQGFVLDLNEIIMYLSSVDEIINAINNYLETL